MTTSNPVIDITPVLIQYWCMGGPSKTDRPFRCAGSCTKYNEWRWIGVFFLAFILAGGCRDRSATESKTDPSVSPFALKSAISARQPNDEPNRGRAAVHRFHFL